MSSMTHTRIIVIKSCMVSDVGYHYVIFQEKRINILVIIFYKNFSERLESVKKNSILYLYKGTRNCYICILCIFSGG